jgi:hypothetical protein
MNVAALFGTGLGLAAGAGLNAYAVLLAYGLIIRLFPEDYPGTLAGVLSSTPALAVFATMFLLEFFADKIPGLDHFWDLVQTIVRPLAGAVLAVASVSPSAESPLLTALAGGSGGGIALVSHLLKSATRLTSTALTGGVANVALSLAEDVVALLQTLVSVFLPLLSLVLVAALAGIFVLCVPRISRSVNLFGRRRGGATGPDCFSRYP